MSLVAWISYQKTKGEVEDKDGYFLAGRGLSGAFIAGSLLLTNISAEHLVGMNGNSYRGNLSGMGWEVTAAIAIVIMAVYILPKYLGGAFTTLPEFLNTRYDATVRRMSVVLFLVGYILVTIPACLYSGALAVLKLFDVPKLIGISFTQSVWLLVWIVGIIGAIYAVFGGLRAVAVSDTLNGIGLIVVGIMVPIFGLIVLGDGSFSKGFVTMTTVHAYKLNAIGGSKDSVPFGTLFTGMIYANLFYWGTNQYVIQRALGAGSLKEGQKGVMFSGLYKIMIPLIVMIPGVIAYHIVGEGLNPVDLAYPAIVTKVLPQYLSGLFLAVLLGAVLSTFNSLLNSAATMFALDIYKPIFNPETNDANLIKVSKYFAILVALVSFCVSPLLMYAPDGIFDIIRAFTGFFNIPTIVLVAVGILTKRVPALAAKVVMVFHVITYYMLVWGFKQIFGINIGINFIHIYFILFWIEVSMMLLIGKKNPRETEYVYESHAQVDLLPWRSGPAFATFIFTAVVMCYVIFSPIGLAYEKSVVSQWFWPVISGVIVIGTFLGFLAHTKGYERYKNYIMKEHPECFDENKDAVIEPTSLKN